MWNNRLNRCNNASLSATLRNPPPSMAGRQRVRAAESAAYGVLVFAVVLSGAVPVLSDAGFAVDVEVAVVGTTGTVVPHRSQELVPPPLSQSVSWCGDVGSAHAAASAAMTMAVQATYRVVLNTLRSPMEEVSLHVTVAP